MCKHVFKLLPIIFVGFILTDNCHALNNLFVHLNGDFVNLVKPDDIEAFYGNGKGASFGIGTDISGFNEIVLWLDYAASKDDVYFPENNYRMNIYTLFLDFRARIPGSKRRIFVPYFDGGLGFTHFSFEADDIDFPGDNRKLGLDDLLFRFGVGLNIETYSRLSFSAGIDYTIFTRALIKTEFQKRYGLEYYRIKIGLIYQLIEK